MKKICGLMFVFSVLFSSNIVATETVQCHNERYEVTVYLDDDYNMLVALKDGKKMLSELVDIAKGEDSVVYMNHTDWVDPGFVSLTLDDYSDTADFVYVTGDGLERISTVLFCHD